MRVRLGDEPGMLLLSFKRVGATEWGPVWERVAVYLHRAANRGVAVRRPKSEGGFGRMPP